MSRPYRGYYIQWSPHENCYQVRKYLPADHRGSNSVRSIVVARRDSESEAKMYIDDEVDGTDKEEQYEKDQIR